jgi:DNA-binding transcriptional MocR family regulator
MDSKGAVVVSQKTLANMMGLHRNTIGRSIKVLESQNWIDTVQLGGIAGGVRCYVVNHRVAWADSRDKKRYASFDARIIASEDEQTHSINNDEPLYQLPRAGEFQIPSGAGLAPPSQPVLPGCEPDLPAIDSVAEVKKKPTKLVKNSLKERALEIRQQRLDAENSNL